MLDHVTASSSGIKQALQAQQQAGRFATHAQLFTSFQDLVMDMQAKILDPAKTHAVQTRDIARIERPSDTGANDYRDDVAARDTNRDPSDDRYAARDRSSDNADDHNVSQRDDAGRDYSDDRRDNQGATQDDRRAEGASNDRGDQDNGRQDAVNRDGNSDHGDGNNGADGQTGTDAAQAGDNAGNNDTAGQQGQGQDAAANVVQANVTAGQVDTLLNTIVAQTMGTDPGAKVAEVAKSMGDQINQAGQQNGQALRDGNHNLAQANQQAQAIRAMANMHTNGQANGDGARQAETLLQAQAGEIAKAAGGNAKMMVNVTVKDDAAALNTRPMAALTAAAVQAGQDAAGQSGQQSQTAQQGQVQNPMVQAAMAQNHLNPSQAQGAQGQGQGQAAQATQAQAAAQLAADAKGPVQAGSGINNAASHSAGGGAEGTNTQANGSSGQTQQTQQSDQAQKTQQQQQAHQATKNKVIDQVSVQINKAIKAGADRINIRLHPADLGRVEIRLEVAADGRTVAVVTADKPDTLDMLRRDSAQLAKALSDAGLDMEAGDLNYNLKGQEEGEKEKSVADGGTADEEAVEDDALAEELMDQAMAAHEMGLLHNGRVDVRA